MVSRGRGPAGTVAGGGAEGVAGWEIGSPDGCQAAVVGHGPAGGTDVGPDETPASIAGGGGCGSELTSAEAAEEARITEASVR